MDAKEFYLYSSACIKRNVVIYPKVINNSGCYKIVINVNGKEKVKDEIYKTEAYKRKKIIKTPTGIKELIEVIPAYHDKVAEYYKEIAIKNKYLQ